MSGSKREAAAPVLVAVATVLAFSLTLGNPFVWDDVLQISENPAIESPSIAAATYLGQPEGRYYRPLVFLLHAIDFRLWGRNPAGFHLTNLLIHLLNVLLLFAVAQRSGVPRRVALLAATLFAVHPVQSEAVAYVSGRTDLLMTMGALLTWRIVGVDRITAWRAMAAAAAVVLALLSKESGFAILPFLAWLAFADPTHRRARARLVAGLCCLGLLLYVLRPGTPPLLVTSEMSLRGMGGVGQSLATYASLVLWPACLHVDRLTMLGDDAATGAAGVAMLLAAATLAVAAVRHGRRCVADWTVWTALFYLPAANLVIVDPSVSARDLFTPEHNAYAPLAGFAVLASLGVEWLIRRVPALSSLIRGLAAAIVLGLMVRTAVRTMDWRSEQRLFAQAIRCGSRSPRVHFNLANIHLANGDAEKATALLETALGIAPDDGKIWMNLAVSRQRLGQLDAALAAYGRAATLLPNNATVWENLGTLELARGELEAAHRAFARAEQIEPGRPKTEAALDSLERLR